MERGHVRVVEAGQDLRFPTESGELIRLVDEPRRQHLQGHAPAEHGVLRQEDPSHPSTSEFTENRIPAHSFRDSGLRRRRTRRRMVLVDGQERTHLGAEFRVSRARAIQKRRPLRRRERKRVVEDLDRVRVAHHVTRRREASAGHAGGEGASLGPPMARMSQTRANDQSRSTVLRLTWSASATSGWESPAKKRSSTTRACLG